MTKSDLYYNAFVKYVNENLLNYLKDAPKYHSQFFFNTINELCNREMYNSIKPSLTYPTRQSFFDLIPELKDECSLCYKYFLNPRNKSIKGLDVQLGKQLEEALMIFLKDNFKIKIERADIKNRSYPDLMILDKTRNIFGYIELKYHAAPFVFTHKFRPGRECYEGSLTLDKKKIEKQIEIIISEIDRPVFYLHWVDFPCIKGLFFQTSEQLYDMMKNSKLSDEFERKERTGDFIKKEDGVRKVGYTDKFYPSITEMGNFEELISILSKI